VQGFAVHLERIASLGDEQLDKAPLNDTLSYAFEAYARHFLYRHTDIRHPSYIDGSRSTSPACASRKSKWSWAGCRPSPPT
jgi:hypothetical protein